MELCPMPEQTEPILKGREEMKFHFLHALRFGSIWVLFFGAYSFRLSGLTLRVVWFVKMTKPGLAPLGFLT